MDTAVTRYGTQVKIYDTDGGGDYPILGAWHDEASDRWIPHAWMDDGWADQRNIPKGLDIVKVEKDKGMD